MDTEDITKYMLLCNNTVALGINKQHAVSTPDFFKIMALIGILLLSWQYSLQ